MNADRLLALYEKVAEAPDAIARLRRLVLDLAVRGKLVKQDASDEPASELLKRIAAERAQLVKSGEIRKPKSISLADDVAEEVPSNWALVPLGEVVLRHLGGGTPSKSNESYWNGDLRWASVKDVGKSKYLDETVDRITEAGLGNSSSNLIEPGNLIVVTRMGLGQVSLNRIPVAINQHLRALYLSQHVSIDYAYDFFLTHGFEGTGLTVKGIKLEDLLRIPLPLPPLAEQQRIVAKVEELMALLDRLEAAHTDREATRDRLTAASLARLTAPDTAPADFPANARFALDTLPALTSRPDQIKAHRQTILNLAVRGKLVEQDPADEPASELLNRIAAERAAFLDDDYPNPSEAKTQKKKQARQQLPAKLPELPRGWSWATLQQCSLMVIDCKNKTAPYSSSGIKLVRTTNVRDGALNSNDQKFVSEATYEAWSLRAKPEPGDILITREAPMGEVCVIPDGEKICLGQRMMLARLVPDTIAPRFILYSLRDPNLMERVQDKPLGMTVQHLRVGGVETLLVPLPPLAEQHRIVAKVDALMALCDRLEAALTTSDTTRARLLEALLHETLSGEANPETQAA